MSLYNDKRISWLIGVIYGVDEFHIVREGE